MLRGWFESTFGDGALLAQFVVATILLVFVLAILAWLLGRRSGNGVSKGPARGRQPRLSVMEAAVVDGKRRLVLVRRDQIEHLVMIGGPSDIVVETNIVRGRPAGYAQQGRRPAAAQRPPAQAPASHAPPQAPAAPVQQMSPPAAALAATSAAAAAAAVLRRPTGAAAAEPAPESAAGNGAGYAVRSGANGAGRSYPDASPEISTDFGHREYAGNRPSAAQAPETAPDDERAEPHLSSAAASLQDIAPAADERSDAHPSGIDSAASPQPETVKNPAGSMAFAGLAAGAAALAAAAGTKSQKAKIIVPPVEPDMDVPAEEPPAPVETAEIADDMVEMSDIRAEAEAQPADDMPPADTGQPDEPVGLAAGPVAADPFGDLESEFKKAFESSLQDLKAEVNAETAKTGSGVSQVEMESAVEEPAEPLVAETIPDLPEPYPAELSPFDTSRVEPADEFDEDEQFEADTALSDVDDGEAIGANADDMDEDMAESDGPVFESMLPGAGGADDETPDMTEETASSEIDLDDMEASLNAREDGGSAFEPLSPEAAADMPEDTHETMMSDFVETETAEDVDFEPEPEEPPQAEFEAEPEAEVELEAEAEPDEAVLEADDDVAAEEDIAASGRSPSGLPAELAFLDTPADEEPDAEPEAAESEPALEPAAESVAVQPPPRPVNPFPTIPDSVRKSVMAAASRAVSPDVAEGLSGDAGGSDIATTTLGDLAQRLEKALSEQANPTDGAMASDEAEAADAEAASADEAAEFDDEPAEDGDDRAVIDFHARRKEEPEDTLEDEMAKLLNDLTGDTNRVG